MTAFICSSFHRLPSFLLKDYWCGPLVPRPFDSASTEHLSELILYCFSVYGGILYGDEQNNGVDVEKLLDLLQHLGYKVAPLVR